MDALALKRRLLSVAGERYRSSGRFAYHFARGKLSSDPVYTAILALGLIADKARILDLGCGQGVLAAWLLAAEESRAAGAWCPAWAPPPAGWRFHGVERMSRDVERAHRALGDRVAVQLGDIRSAAFGEADAVIILDVLHYMDREAQEAVLRRVRAALSAGGLLLLRVGDAAGGLPFSISNWVDQIVLLLRGRGLVQLHSRPIPDWIEMLERIGFQTKAMPMSADTPFANVLLVARPQ